MTMLTLFAGQEGAADWAAPTPDRTRARRLAERRMALVAIASGLEAELDECIDLATQGDCARSTADYFERRACRVASRLATVRARIHELGGGR